MSMRDISERGPKKASENSMWLEMTYEYERTDIRVWRELTYEYGEN